MNYLQNKKINEKLKDNRKVFNLDKAERDIREMLLLNGLSNAEIAALLFTIMRNTLSYETNKRLLDSNGVTELTLETVLNIQAALIGDYAREFNDTQTAEGTTEADS